jgi:hypothetical protein
VKNGGNEKIEGNLNPVLVVRTGNWILLVDAVVGLAPACWRGAFIVATLVGCLSMESTVELTFK